MPVYPQTASFRDAKGQTAKTSFFVSAATPALALTAAEAIINLLTPLSNASMNNAKGAYTTSPAENLYGVDVEYATIEDKAVMTFQTASGAIHRYQVPAPMGVGSTLNMFLADGETVDSAQANVAAFTAAMVANHACSRDGSLIAAYIGGMRRRSKYQRKYNIFTLNPAESGPGE